MGTCQAHVHQALSPFCCGSAAFLTEEAQSAPKGQKKEKDDKMTPWSLFSHEVLATMEEFC